VIDVNTRSDTRAIDPVRPRELVKEHLTPVRGRRTTARTVLPEDLHDGKLSNHCEQVTLSGTSQHTTSYKGPPSDTLQEGVHPPMALPVASRRGAPEDTGTPLDLGLHRLHPGGDLTSNPLRITKKKLPNARSGQ
jgi:hypothetical protein